MKNIYEQCVAAGLEIDHHESDLYIKDCPAARDLLGKNEQNFDEFEDSKDIKWLEVPFAYQPFWDKKAKI